MNNAKVNVCYNQSYLFLVVVVFWPGSVLEKLKRNIRIYTTFGETKSHSNE